MILTLTIHPMKSMMKNIRHAIFSFLALIPMLSGGQVISLTPSYPVDSDSCTVIFDAAQGNAGLKDVTTAIYAHTGVITNLSTSPSDWKYVVAGWSVNTPKALLTPLGNNKHKLTLKPSIRNYYNVPAGEEILKLAFVFRNADGSKTGRNADGSDIFGDVYPDNLIVNIIQPDKKDLLVKLNEPIQIAAASPLADQMNLYLNGTVIKSGPGQTIEETINANHFGQYWVKHWVKAEGINSTGNAADSFSYTVMPDPEIASLPQGIIEGINYLSTTSATLCLYAPGKNNVFATGDFNNWQLDADHYMKKTPDGKHFWVELNNLNPGEEYIFQYVVDGSLRIGDPYADKVSDPEDQYISASTYPNLKPYPTGKTSGIATYLQTAREPYPWKNLSFTPPAVKDLVIYELLLRDFLSAHNYLSLMDTLSYMKSLGINAIELMPVMEFEGNISWGYNPNFSFAVDKYYGTKNQLKAFIDTCHGMGIAVILDIVCNHHFGSSPLARLYWDGVSQRPAANNPWFNPIPKHPYNVGNDFNHESPDTRRYMERLLRYWIVEFKVDGYRFDLSKGLTQKNSYPDNVSLWGQYDAARIDILKHYTQVVHAANPNAYAIMEHFADNAEETVLASNNMMLWGNMTYNYQEATMGYHGSAKSDFSWAWYKKRGWDDPHLIAYMESHDEERMMFKNIAYGNATQPPYNPKDTGIALKRAELAATFFFTIPGPKMIWQFGEMGYDYSINYPSGTEASRLTPKPIRWDYLKDWRRRYTKNIFAELIKLKTTQPVFSTDDITTDLSGAVKRMWLKHSTMDATVLGNFDIITREVNPDFPKTGKWYEFFTGDSLEVSNPAQPLSFLPGEYRLYTNRKLAKPMFTSVEELQPGHSGSSGTILTYPNPSDGQCTLVFFHSGKPQQARILVVSPAGMIISDHYIPVSRSGPNELSLDFRTKNGNLPAPGLYLIKIMTDEASYTGKLVLQP